MHTLQLTFNLRIQPKQIYDFRGALIHLAGPSNDLFHNREYNNGTWGNPIERYPLIQYRIQKGHAAVWAMDDGITQLQTLLQEGNIPDFSMYGVATPLYYLHRNTTTFTPSLSTTWHYYTLAHFIPFNKETYEVYKALDTYIEKINYLEKKITDEILLFSYALKDWTLSRQEMVKVEITDILKISTALLQTKDDKRKPLLFRPLSFRLCFRSNAVLPAGISLGRHKAYGYGTLLA